MRASYGTTKYCMAFLRGVSCQDHSCMNLHEWGDEKDCFTKEDLTTLYVTLRVRVVLAEFLPTLLQETYHEGYRDSPDDDHDDDLHAPRPRRISHSALKPLVYHPSIHLLDF